MRLTKGASASASEILASSAAGQAYLKCAGNFIGKIVFVVHLTFCDHAGPGDLMGNHARSSLVKEDGARIRPPRPLPAQKT